ncbi:MAG: zinc ABC transporter substrate-binding protein [Desulfobacteraceae bacterium]|nr:zinc ABC transporter substrate-binding protein [Desulfobacteraceae bacterium]
MTPIPADPTKSHRRSLWVIGCALLAALLSTAEASARIRVFVSIPPQTYFLEQIAGERVDVHVMVVPGASPATYEPRPRQMVALGNAAAYFAIGVPFEKAWLSRISSANPGLIVVRADRGIEKIPISGVPHTEDGQHAGGTDPDTAAPDPHIWTSPPLVKIVARNIRDALQRLDPANRLEYQTGYERFASRLDILDAELRRTFEGKAGSAFMVMHPSWGYFARTYGLRQIPVEIEGKEPKPAQLAGLIENARSLGVRVVFVQPQFSTRSARRIADAIDGKVVLADPLAEDWEANLRRQAAAFQEALR